MKTINVRLAGGLGNQLFQFFSALSLVKNCESKIALDLSSLALYETSKSFEINFIIDIIGGLNISYRLTFFSKIFSKLRLGRLLDGFTLFRYKFISSKSTIDSLPEEYYEQVLMDGYFQHPNLLPARDEIKCLFNKLKERYSYLHSRFPQSNSEYIAIHIRRGDYVSSKRASKVFKSIPLSFYYEAIKKFPESSIFFVFGDDAEMTSSFSKSFNGIDVSSFGLRLDEEFMLMTMASSYIIANSTFSWWAAYIGWDELKRVIAPRKWFVDECRNLKNPLLMQYFEILD